MVLGGIALALLLAPSGEAAMLRKPLIAARPTTSPRDRRRIDNVRAGSTGRCFETMRPVASGVPLSGQDIVAVPCRAERVRGWLRYDRAQAAPLAAQPLAAGTYLGPVAPISDPWIAKGATLTLRSVAGPVTIERQVTTMQAGRAGGRVFVRDASGTVFAAPLVLAETGQ